MIRTVLGMAVFVAAASVAMAQSDSLSQRKALMKGNGQGAGALSKMAKGEEPYDQAKVNAAFAQISEAAHKAPALFPEAPKAGEETRALPKIWETKSDFDAKMANFTKAVNDNKDKVKNVDDLKLAMGQISKTCGDCHEPYRKPQQAR
jgi:cytochrome c556